MAESSVVSSIKVKTTSGLMDVDIYDDGEIVFFSPGKVLFAIDAGTSKKIGQAVSNVFGLAQTSCVTPNTSSPVIPVNADGIKRSVSKDDKGWGASVGLVVGGKLEIVRYYYDSRSTARDAMPDHKIGEAGRVA